MRQWLLLFFKEQKEMIRNFKWIWVPLVFIILGMTQPISSYYMPQIIESFGGLPEGTVIEIPLPTGMEVLVATFGQFSQMGILILVLATMGIIASERSTGSYLMILVKPVSYTAYLTAKWASISLLSISSFILGYIFAVYYTQILYDGLVIKDVVVAGVVYLIWLVFIMTVVLLFSSFMKSNAAIASLTLATTVLLSIFSSIFTKLLYWTPARLTTQANSILLTGSGADHFWVVISLSLVSITGLLFLTTVLFKKKELVS